VERENTLLTEPSLVSSVLKVTFALDSLLLLSLSPLLKEERSVLKVSTALRDLTLKSLAPLELSPMWKESVT